jgi:hypothetical protein
LWKLKYKNDFSKDIYFNFWTLKENYIAKTIKYFAFGICFDKCHGFVNQYLYEYHPVILNILNTFEKAINIVKFNINKQFILIKNNSNNSFRIIGQYENEKQAMDDLKFDRENGLGVYVGYLSYNYVIIDLKYSKPYFLKIKTKVDERASNIGNFY